MSTDVKVFTDLEISDTGYRNAVNVISEITCRSDGISASDIIQLLAKADGKIYETSNYGPTWDTYYFNPEYFEAIANQEENIPLKVWMLEIVGQSPEKVYIQIY